MASTGIIKNYLPDKKYGFILGDDKKLYFFHKKNIDSHAGESHILDGAPVEFDPGLSEKGYKATKITIGKYQDIEKYTIPENVISSKTDTIRGWDIVKTCDWVVTATGRGDPNDVRKMVELYSATIGANGVVNMSYTKGQGSEGNYQFTLHTITGRPVYLARRHLSGTCSTESFPDLNANCEELKKQSAFDFKSAQSRRNKQVVGGIAIGALGSFFNIYAGMGFALFLGIAAALAFAPKEKYVWLWRFENIQK